MTPQDEAHIKALEEENRRLREALTLSVNVLQKHHEAAITVWAQAVEAELKARAALKGAQS